MDDRWNNEDDQSSTTSWWFILELITRFIAGAILLIAAGAATYWLMTSLFLLWETTAEIGMVKFFEHLATENSSVLVIPAGTVEFPSAWTVIVGVFFCVLLLSIVATLITSLFREAFRILFPPRNVINKND
jgi:hypothetical protein